MIFCKSTIIGTKIGMGDIFGMMKLFYVLIVLSA